ncbi:MAG: mechanosensitive ion channel family protein [Eubacterium sp.]
MNIINSVLGKLAAQIDGVETEQEMLIRLIIALAVFFIMLIFKNQISKAITWLACKIFFRKSVKAQTALSGSLSKPLSYFICVLGIYIGTEIAVPTGEIESKALLLLKLAFIVFAAWFGVNLINSDYTVKLNEDSSKARKTAAKFINNVLKAVILVVAGLLILEQFGISASRIFAALGIGGVAVAFACKDTVENMLSGFIIIFDKPFEVDDFIEINGDSGTVADIKIRSTRLIGVDGCEKIYPNTAVANAAITNWSKMEKRAFSETLWINYNHSADEINEFCTDIKKIILDNEKVIPEDVRVNFTEYGTHALEISLFFYVKTVAIADFLKFKNDINVAIKEYADSSNMELAFESKTVYFGNGLSVKK